MDQNLESGGDVRTGVPTYVMDALVAALLFLLGVVVVVTSWKLGAGWTSDGPGSGYFPFGIGIIVTISGAMIMFQALLGKNKNTEVFVDAEQFRRVMQVFIPAIFYVGAIQFIGVYISSAVYIALFMILLGKFSVFKSVSIAVIINVLLFLLFEVWFKVPLYKGYIDLLSFLGY